MFSKNYKVIPLHLERQIPFLERSQRSGRDYQPGSFLQQRCARRAGLPSRELFVCRVPGISGRVRLTKPGVLARGAAAGSFCSLLEACWERRGDAAVAQPPLRGFVLCILNFPQCFMDGFSLFLLPCSPSSAVGPCLHTALAMSCWGV